MPRARPSRLKLLRNLHAVSCIKSETNERSGIENKYDEVEISDEMAIAQISREFACTIIV